MKFEYKTRGVCSSKIIFEVEDSIVKNIQIVGGCAGNSLGVSKLAEGRNIDELINCVNGIKCGFKNTSCPDQLSLALLEAKKKLTSQT